MTETSVVYAANTHVSTFRSQLADRLEVITGFLFGKYGASFLKWVSSTGKVRVVNLR
jgi:hypothetical protein